MSSLPPDLDPSVRAVAWIGDAVLALYVREWILSFNNRRMDGEIFVSLTSNQFLRLVGNATEVEAQIGRAYYEGGMTGAYAWIDSRLRPLMEERLHIIRSRGRQKMSGGTSGRRPVMPSFPAARSEVGSIPLPAHHPGYSARG